MRYNQSMDKEAWQHTFEVGVFGGAFDPPHNQHVRLMQEVIRLLGLKRLVVLPSGNAPHKHTATSYADRLDMLRLATAHIPQVVIDTSEEGSPTPTYSAVMLPRLHAKYGRFVHIIGGDSIVAMPTWYHPAEVMRFPHVVVARGQADARLMTAIEVARNAYGADVHLLPITLPDLSATAVRASYLVGLVPTTEDLRCGRLATDRGEYYPMSNGVCYAVHDYIRTHELYNDYAPVVAEVPRHISPERWAHTQQVALMALRLNAQLGLPEHKVITAALLHDCMKGAQHVYPAVPDDCRQPAVLHAFNGAEEARYRYAVEDEDVLAAIRYHTTGRAAMSDLERLIYLADYCEATRTFEGASAVRNAALGCFDAGFIAAVCLTHRHLADKGGDLCRYGEECYRYYCQNK